MLISIVIKTLNEEKMIGQCLASAIEAMEGLDYEIILVDSLSSDRTIEIASTFPVTIFQLQNSKDRSCGVGGQIGFQHANGDYLLMLDGDMLLQRDFVFEALKTLDGNQKIAAVGGLLDEQATSFEFRWRMEKKRKQPQEGPVSYLAGGGLYRMAALRQIAYFTNINLHSHEELEVGLRLQAAGWGLYKLPVYWVKHFGHMEAPLPLMARRWKLGYFKGPGELLSMSIAKPYFIKVLKTTKHLVCTVFWWMLLVLLIGAGFILSSFHQIWWLIAAVFLCPIIALSIKKRSASSVLYSLTLWNIQSLASLVGFFRQKKDPVTAIIPVRQLHGTK